MGYVNYVTWNIFLPFLRGSVSLCKMQALFFVFFFSKMDLNRQLMKLDYSFCIV